jgi:hypothetical protein
MKLLPLWFLYLVLKVQHCYVPANIYSCPFDLIETFLKTIQNHNQRKIEEQNRVTKIDKEGATEREKSEGREEDGKKGNPWGADKNKLIDGG